MPQDPEKAQEFKAELIKRRIEYWEPSEKSRQESGVKSWIIPRDGHPSAEANLFYAKFLIRQMEEKKL
jgi:hypothetical protein